MVLVVLAFGGLVLASRRGESVPDRYADEVKA